MATKAQREQRQLDGTYHDHWLTPPKMTCTRRYLVHFCDDCGGEIVAYEVYLRGVWQVGTHREVVRVCRTCVAQARAEERAPFCWPEGQPFTYEEASLPPRRFSDAEVQAIRRAERPFVKVARQYGVSWMTVYRIRKRITCLYVPEEEVG